MSSEDESIDTQSNLESDLSEELVLDPFVNDTQSDFDSNDESIDSLSAFES
jgi:hypothetical protein